MLCLHFMAVNKDNHKPAKGTAQVCTGLVAQCKGLTLEIMPL
jgi:hypothetical protein